MLKLCEVLATVFSVAGFFMVSNNLEIGFKISLLSNFLWLVWAYNLKAQGIFTVNLFLGLAAINGILGGLL